jgi:hypothetical protein
MSQNCSHITWGAYFETGCQDANNIKTGTVLVELLVAFLDFMASPWI